MKRDKRTKSVGFQAQKDHIDYFWQLFEVVPKSTVARHLGIHFARMNKLVDNVKEIKYKDLLLLSNYFRVEPEYMFRLVRTQHVMGSKPKLRRSGRRQTAEKKHAKKNARQRATRPVKRRSAKRAQRKTARRKRAAG